jgi:hypothetical protein
MKSKFNGLFLSLKNKGLSNMEVAGFLTDFRDLRQRLGIPPLDYANLELESLGWGVSIMDMALYRDLISLIEGEALEEFKYYLQQIPARFKL